MASTSTEPDPRDLLTLEALLVRRLQADWARLAAPAMAKIKGAINDSDWTLAVREAQALDLADIGVAQKELAHSVFRASADFGAKMAAGGRALTSTLDFSYTIDRVVSQWLQQIEWTATQQVQKAALQLIAHAQAADGQVTVHKDDLGGGDIAAAGATAQPSQDQAPAKVSKPNYFWASQHRKKKKNKWLVNKASAIRPQVSFQDTGNQALQLASSLHTSRLASWGFLAEAEVRGFTTYKLSAVLDGRTSKFCEVINGKSFRVESARALIDQAVHADDPNELKTIQPWPDQSRASIKQFQGMSEEQLKSAGYTVPPFHPNCRTIMTRIDQEFMSSPTKTYQQVPKGGAKAALENGVLPKPYIWQTIRLAILDELKGLFASQFKALPITKAQALLDVLNSKHEYDMVKLLELGLPVEFLDAMLKGLSFQGWTVASEA